VSKEKVTKINRIETTPQAGDTSVSKEPIMPTSSYHPDRPEIPLFDGRVKKERGNGEDLMDKALDEIASRLTEVKEKYDVRSIGAFHGTAPRQSLLSSNLLASALGTPECDQYRSPSLFCPLNGRRNSHGRT